MSITLQFDHPHFPDGVEFGVPGLGQIPNHGTIEVDDAQAAAFEASNGMSISEAFKNNPMFTVNGVKGVAKAKGTGTGTETETTPTQEVTGSATPVVSGLGLPGTPNTLEGGDE